MIQDTRSTKDITTMTELEQKGINAKILEDWGNLGKKKLIELKNNFTEKDIATSGDAWYYLSQDISTGAKAFSKSLEIMGNIRILLNGYSISGDFHLKAAEVNSKISIFDKIPGKSGVGYEYNPKAIKYYKYNDKLNAYTDYSTAIPLGENVTNMPTWQEDTYIKVIGSAFSSNKMNMGIGKLCLGAIKGTVNMYGINVVGRIGNNFMIYSAYSKIKGIVNLYQCDFLGNLSKNGYGVICAYHRCLITLKGCKVYGNQDDGTISDVGIQPSDTRIPSRECDVNIRSISLNVAGTIVMYKSNVGVLACMYYYSDGRATCYDRAIYVKDVDFVKEVSISDHNVPTFFEEIDNIHGTIELVFRSTTTYNGKSPNLNFIVHGGDSEDKNIKGYNNFTVGEKGVVDNIITVCEPVNNDITIHGVAFGVSTSGNVIIGSKGNVIAQHYQKIDGFLINQGNFFVETEIVIINQLLNYGDFIINRGRCIGELFINYNNFIIKRGKCFGDSFINYGTLTIYSINLFVTAIINNANLIIQPIENSNNNDNLLIDEVTNIKITDTKNVSGTILNKGKIIYPQDANLLINTIK